MTQQYGKIKKKQNFRTKSGKIAEKEKFVYLKQMIF